LNRYHFIVKYINKLRRPASYIATIEAEDLATATQVALRQCQRRAKPKKIVSTKVCL